MPPSPQSKAFPWNVSWEPSSLLSWLDRSFNMTANTKACIPLLSELAQSSLPKAARKAARYTYFQAEAKHVYGDKANSAEFLAAFDIDMNRSL
mmetsp:Transcript_13953/g.30515  ORF Transcript_13953/g.30515 Transcript_13953/m.30515 type:complete len:93 (-) Transcript_13953:366-644(-)